MRTDEEQQAHDQFLADLQDEIGADPETEAEAEVRQLEEQRIAEERGWEPPQEVG